MNNKLIPIVITLVVGIILAGSVLMPVLNDATTTERTFENEGVFDYGIFAPDDTYSVEFDADTGKLTVGTVEIDPLIPSNKTGAYSIIASDNVLLRYGHTSSYYYLQCVGRSASDTTVSADVISATINDGQLYVTKNDGETQYVFDFTEMYCIVVDEAEAVLKQSTSAVYIKGDSMLYASGLTLITNWNNMFHFEGTYNDGITISSANTDATFSNITWNIEAVDGYIDLYKLTSIEFDITYNDTVTHATYSYFGVPSEVTAELSQHLTPGQIALLGAIPVLVIVALLVVAVGVVARRND